MTMYKYPVFFIMGLLLSLQCMAVPHSNSDKEELSERPNILIAISDDQSHPYASVYGIESVRTPAFDRVAEEGILFNNAFVTSPGCAPSRSSILTGRYPWQNEEAGGHQTLYPVKYKVYPDVLEDNGYFIGYTGKGCGPFNWRLSGRERNMAGPSFNEIRYRSEDEVPAKGISDINYAANFESFLKARPQGKPFYFWYGAREPHRQFEEGSGEVNGKKQSEAFVPGFLPDQEEIRTDILDYALEVDWFDLHLEKILNILDEQGELSNTLIIVTSDNGMAFPRAKANCYEYGIHVPLAIMWQDGIHGGRTVDDLISLADIAPTILDITGLDPQGMMPLSARSFKNILFSNQSGLIDDERDAVFSGRERHSSARWCNLGYPIRSIRTNNYLYIRNYYPERWPAGAPQMLNVKKPSQKMGYYGLDSHGKFAKTAFFDIDPGLSIAFMAENHDQDDMSYYMDMAVGKRPYEELYDIKEDPYCLNNLANTNDYKELKNDMSEQLDEFLKETKDPRMVGPNPDIFENYQRFFIVRPFPRPDWSTQ